MPQLDLSANTKIKFINAYNLDELQKINMRNNKASSVFINLGNEFNLPHNVCIEVDDPIKANNKQVPYDNWTIQRKHYFDSLCTLSVEKFVTENFKVYPNPTSEYVVIDQKDTENVHIESVQIIDNTGKWIRSVKENFNYINVSDLASGTYLFVIQTNKGNKVEKVIVQ